MAKTEFTKKRLLEIIKILWRDTDEAHRLSTQDLIRALEKEGITSERKAIYRDIQLLSECGFDIDSSHQGHCILSRGFELTELKLLADAVQCSRGITEKKSYALIGKLETLTSRYNAAQLHRQLHLVGRPKTDNESIYYNVDAIYEAIQNKRQICFRYLSYQSDGTRIMRPKLYQASPYGLCWDNENYYLIAHTVERGRTHYRVDRMNSIKMLSEPRIASEEYVNLNLADYSKQVFGMFGGNFVNVTLEFSAGLADSAIDRFGRDVMLIPNEHGGFRLTAPVALSPVFYSWVFSFSGRVKILQPEIACNEYAEMCKKAIECIPNMPQAPH